MGGRLKKVTPTNFPITVNINQKFTIFSGRTKVAKKVIISKPKISNISNPPWGSVSLIFVHLMFQSIV